MRAHLVHLRRFRRSLVLYIASAALVATLAAPAGAQFNLFDWTLHDPGGTDITHLTPDGMSILANWPTLGGGAIIQYSAVAPVSGHIHVTMDYMDFDGVCGLSVPAFVINGVPILLASCTTYGKELVLSVPAGATFGLGLQTFNGRFPGEVGFSNFQFEPVPPFTPWTDLGNGLASSNGNGVPMLQGVSLLYPHFPLTLELSSAAANSPVVLVVGLAQLNAPFKGGVMVPSVDVLLTGLVTDATGALNLATPWLGAPPGFAFYLQAWVADLGAPAGFSASNGLRAQTP